MRSWGNAAQLTVTKGLSARELAECRACATNSFPVPLSPRTRMGSLPLAKIFPFFFKAMMALLLPMMLSKVYRLPGFLRTFCSK